MGSDVFQEADITGAVESFVKYSYIVKNVEDIPRVFKEAFYIANSGRRGPVLIDVPIDIQKVFRNCNIVLYNRFNFSSPPNRINNWNGPSSSRSSAPAVHCQGSGKQRRDFPGGHSELFPEGLLCRPLQNFPEAPHLLAVRQRQTKRLQGADLSAPLHAGHYRQRAH